MGNADAPTHDPRCPKAGAAKALNMTVQPVHPATASASSSATQCKQRDKQLSSSKSKKYGTWNDRRSQ